MFGIFKSSKPKQWTSLTDEQKHLVTKKLISTAKNLAGPRYKIVSGSDQWNRELGITETLPEDGILDQYSRGRMLSMARNAVRNSSTLNAILKQFDYNAVGTKGGKVILNFDDYEASKRVLKEFKKWTREADFFDGLSLNTVLKLILKEYIIGGDMVVLFDDAMVEDSGKILVYESDEIGNTSKEAIEKHYGKNAHQSLGRVYNSNGRFIGVVVSRSQRGAIEFNADASYLLKRIPNESMFDCPWIMPRNIFRFAQGRGTSQMASSLATIIDLEDTCSYEIQAAKKNAQTIAQVIQKSDAESEVAPSVFDSTTDFENLSEEQINEAIKQEQQEQPVITFDKVRTAGVIYEVMPENVKMELLDTKHPNQQMSDFIEFLQAKSGAVFGLTKQFATLAVEDSNYKSQVLFAQPAFDECQKFLEQILDWIFYRWCQWAAKKNIINVNDLPENFMSYVSWTWNKMSDLDENSHQDAVAKKLTNLTGTLKEELGANYRSTLIQIKEEMEFCEKNGLPHPAFNLKSGGYRPELETIGKNQAEEEE